jgi:hypothetical protein
MLAQPGAGGALNCGARPGNLAPPTLGPNPGQINPVRGSP